MTKAKPRTEPFLNPEEQKTCTKCQRVVNIRWFHRSKEDPSEKVDVCFKCVKAAARQEWEKTNPMLVRNFAQAQAQRRNAEPKRDKFIDYVRQGNTIKKCCELVGVQLSTYQHWRKSVPRFKDRVDAARSQLNMDELPPDWFQKDFAGFRKKYFGWQTYPHQVALVKSLETTQPQKITLCLLPAEHGKTTTVEDFVCQILAKEPNHRFGIVSESQGHARKMIGRIQRRMIPLSPTDYTIRFGPFKSEEEETKPWRADYFTVAKSQHDERDASVAAVGWTSQVYGSRFDTLIVDDIQSRRSLNRTDDMLRTFRQDFLSRVGKNGHTVIIGTRVGMGDFYERLMEEQIPHEVIRFPALNDAGEALCPELWNVEQLAEKRRQVGEEVWHTAYQQEPSTNQLSTFTDDIVELCKDMERGIGLRRKSGLTAVSLDPALGGGNALTAWEFTVDKMYLLDCEKVFNLARTEDILSRVENYALRYRPSKLIVERDAFQKGLASDERLRALAKKYGFQIISHLTARAKSDEIMGVASMAGSFMRGEVRLPYGDEIARATLQPLLTELRNWRPNLSSKLLEQDLVMSSWFAWKNWLEVRDAFSAEPAFEWRPRFMLPAGFSRKRSHAHV